MKLIREPESELEYWATIEDLGGFVWMMRHDLNSGRIDDPKGDVEKDISEAQKILDRLVAELSEKFGVIRPQDTPEKGKDEELPPAPAGKRYYWDWYKEMKTISSRTEYEKIICSACPFSDGLESMIRRATIPCSLFTGTVYRLTTPTTCAVIGGIIPNKDAFYAKIREVHGDNALKALKKKEKELGA